MKEYAEANEVIIKNGCPKGMKGSSCKTGALEMGVGIMVLYIFLGECKLIYI